MQRIWIPIVLICGAMACKQTPEPQTTAVAPPTQGGRVSLSTEAIAHAGITTGKATEASVPSMVQVNGLVDVPPRSLVSISFPYGGFLKSTNLLPGMQVQQGAVLAIMEDQAYVQLQQDYLQALPRLQWLKQDYERQTALREGDASSRKAYELAKADYEMQQVLVKGLSEKLKILGINPQKLTVENISREVAIRAPIQGYIKSVLVNIGKYVNPSDVLFEIVDPRDLHASLTVFEKDYGRLRTGQQVTVWSPAQPDKKYPASIILIARNIDSSRGATVHCHFEGAQQDLLPGMFITAEITTEARLLPVVPETAVVRHLGKHYVFTQVAPGTYQMQEVTIAPVSGGKVALTTNHAGVDQATIVLTGAYALLGSLMHTAEE